MIVETALAPAPPENLLDIAIAERTLAAKAYRRRKAALDGLDAQVQAGIWRSDAVRSTIAEGRRDDALLRANAQEFIEANDGAHDLNLEYRPLLGGFRALKEENVAGAEGFLDKIRPPSDDTELWLQALKLEAQATLARLTGDRLLLMALDRADRLVADRLAPVAQLPAQDLEATEAYADALRIYSKLYFPWRVEALYRRFISRFPEPDPAAALLMRLKTDFQPEDEPIARAWGRIADVVAPVLALRNPSDTSELETVYELQTPVFAVVEGRPERPTVDTRDVDRETLTRAGRSLKAILRALPKGSRPATVLAAWQALAALGLRDFGDILTLLAPIQPDDEALGILVRALRGEAHYRLGRYEDAYLDLLRSEKHALAALQRRSPDQASWSRAERDGLARLAQKAGNALLAIGDEKKADEAYTRAQGWLPDDPVARAIDLINRGNLGFLRNSLTGVQGYVTVDRLLQKRLTDEGPLALQAEKVARHIKSLTAAEQCFREALALVDSSAGTTELAAVCHLNLGNLAWAWAGALEAEGVNQLDQLPLGDGFASQLVGSTFDPSQCWKVAIGHYEQVVHRTRSARSGEARSLAAAALCNLSEVRYLNARGLSGEAVPRRDRELGRALREGAAALAKIRDRRRTGLTPRNAAPPPGLRQTLHPELHWRAMFNIARIQHALRDEPAARDAYRETIASVEALRAGLRLDAWQALFLHDKLEAYEGYIGFLFDQDSVANAAEIFEIIERTKARGFLDLLGEARVDVGFPPELKARCDAVLAQIAACNEAIRAATLADDEPLTRRLLRNQQRHASEWAALQAELAEAQQRDTQLNPPVVTLAEVQANLGTERVLLNYLLGTEASYLVLVSVGEARVFRLPPRRVLELATLPVLYYASWGDTNFARPFRAASTTLAAHLLGPLDARTFGEGKHVLVAPDGVLNYLPFEALLADAAGVAALAADVTFEDLAPYYLIQFADVSYIPSASAWRELTSRPVEPHAASLLAVYDLRYDTGDDQPPTWALPILMKLENVPGASDVRKAIEQVRTVWPDQPVVQVRSRNDAGQPEDAAWQPTEENFLRIAAGAEARFVIFNGHAIYNDKHPSLSGLVFNLHPASEPDMADIPSDNFLRVEELFRLELPGAELTFLAACQTALGAYYRGEGLTSLLRAFMYRGSPAVVATLWAVDANAASWLLRRFFKLMAEQPEADPARLFSQAKRKSIGFDNRWLPFHWAPFIFSGGTR